MKKIILFALFLLSQAIVTLAQNSEVRKIGCIVEIFDLRGNLVKTFNSQSDGLPLCDIATGGYPKIPFIWQPDDEINGGVYLVKVKTKKGKIITKKIVYLKK